LHIETTQKPSMEPLKHGFSGWLTRAGGMMSGPVPLALRLLSVAAGRGKMRRMAAMSSIAGSLITRYAWMQAGHASAKDYRLPLEISEERGEVQPISVEEQVAYEREEREELAG
jgi:hypothetical protein